MVALPQKKKKKKKIIQGVVFAFQTHSFGVARFNGFKPFASMYAEFREKLSSFEKAQMRISS